MLLVLFAIGVGYDATMKQYPLLKYLSSDWYADPINWLISDDVQTIVICVAATITILQCIWVAVIMYHAIKKSFTKTLSEVE